MPDRDRPIAEVLRSAGATVFERGWLSSNNILLRGNLGSALVDSGYATHATHTLALVEHELRGAPLDRLLNTHLHSDHCGGNAALQQRYSQLETLIPPGQAAAVSAWDEDQLTYRPTGQQCPRFAYDGLLHPGKTVVLGRLEWEIHGAKGHDPHAVVLHQAEEELLISADALWYNGFGVVFPELEGIDAFDEISETLDLIEHLSPKTVVPGHGSVFNEVRPALMRARSRLEQFVRSPAKHQRYAMKVLLKFRLLEWQQIERDSLETWARNTPYMAQSMPKDRAAATEWLDDLLKELAHAGALEMRGNQIINL